ncbi:endonuclease/exonuclease/phosphatase family protein [Amycolatopsis sp. PS_44_ISF1]|uniref:endonuclease/exonuclease/phosphatase family protein n=1 Tax=Amycolatopsis sp. PS_44_ISF1 TaxID=2974917 RepID=UPI0028E07E06|nr:endonuclease/exonuclease/phosphatase family protein [Amycolatopsis sp. PS_44_ISF1]MDT8913236.1 endonuclease/exonuclease/phosphatase family protein [Amycolatopsis sp. PS_44_ISF1]
MLSLRRPRALVPPALALALAALLLGHRLVPDLGGAGTLVDSFLPWFGLGVLPIAGLALVLRSRSGPAALLVPVLAWAALFVPSAPDGGPGGLTVVTQNVGAGNPEAGAAAAALAGTGAGLVAVQERTGRTGPAIDSALRPGHPYRAFAGTVGLWSRYPLGEMERLDLAQGWARALRARVRLPSGPVTVYVAHLASIRLGETAARDRALAELTGLLRADRSPRVLVLGDLNTASTDRRFDALAATVPEVRTGFGFTWPAAFPLTRPDHVLARGLTPAAATVLPAHGSDHLALQADFRP